MRSEVLNLTELDLLVRRLSHEFEGALAGEEPAAHKQLKASRNYSTRAQTPLEKRPIGLVISAAPGVTTSTLALQLMSPGVPARSCS